MNEHDSLEQIADRYRSDGYDVWVRPGPEELPPFLATSDILLYAEKGRESLTLHSRPNAPPSLPGVLDHGAIMASRDPDSVYLRALLSEAERSMRAGIVESALLLGSAVLEGALREALRRKGIELRRQTPRDLMMGAYHEGVINIDEWNDLERGWRLRNAVAHGMRPDVISTDVVNSFLAIARRLLTASVEIPESDAAYGFRNVRYGHGIRQSGELLGLVQSATRMLAEILGSSAGLVSTEWDRTADARGETVITLRLSDFTGAVTGTLSVPELRSHPQLHHRLHRLWGDLLQVRNHQQLEGLVAGERGGS